MVGRLKNLFRFGKGKGEESPFPLLFERFQSILKRNNEVLELIAEMGDKLGGNYVFDGQYILTACERMNETVYRIVYDLNMLTSQKYTNLYHAYERIQQEVRDELEGKRITPGGNYTFSHELITRDNLQDVGGKNANLGELKNVLKLPTADGFAISTRAFHDFMVHNNLLDTVQEIPLQWEKNDGSFDVLAGKLRDKIIEGEIPSSIVNEIRASIEKLRLKYRVETLFFAVRSSAKEEDTEHSFAGQYESFLNVPEHQLLEHYKKVLASAYSPVAWKYRLERGFQEHEISMAVGCQLMVDPQCSGILYTMDPSSPQKEVMVVTATWGLGVPVVEGSSTVDQYLLKRDAPYPLQHMSVVHKKSMLVCDETGGTKVVEVPEEMQHKPCLNSSQLENLAHAAILIERYYKRPQDIEWAFDKDGKMMILQTRPLRVHFGSKNAICEVPDTRENYKVIFSGKGEVAQRGIGYGKVFIIEKDEDLDNIPYGAILVARHTSPRLTKVIQKVQGILTDIGSPTGHMATVAREFRVPTIVNTENATKVLKTGDEVTVDATQNVVYSGLIRELCYYELTVEEVFEESYEYRLLRRILKRIAVLNLVDPHDESFSPEGCRTYHDIVRFVHEKAVDELMHLGEKYRRKLQSGLKRLEMSIPLGLFVLDIGGGIESEIKASFLRVENIVSVPMVAFLKGLVDSELWAREAVSVDLGSFMSSLTRTFSSSMASPDQVGRNLVVLSKEYMNISLRLGYHFNIIDAYISQSINDNYAYFRFLGGVTDITRRSRRARFIAEVLERHDFRIEIRGDLVIGRLKKLPADQMETQITMLGALVAYTRQLDVLMKHDDHILKHVEDFEEKVVRCLNQHGWSKHTVATPQG